MSNVKNFFSKIRGLFATLSIMVGLAGIIIFMQFYKKKNNARNIRKYCSWFFPANGFKVEFEGEFDKSATLYVLNHQSAVDIICLEGYHPLNICWIAKKQLGDIPFYGYALKTPEMILIDREDKRGLIHLINESKQKLKEGRPLVIFPEGTRNKDINSFLPFKSGAKLLAEKLNLKVQPIVLVNTAKMYSSKPISSSIDHMKVICLESFEVMDKEGEVIDKNWYDKMKEKMLETYKANLNLDSK